MGRGAGPARRAGRQIFLTHFHPDHLGAAADLRELTGARVCQGRIDAEQAEIVWQNDGWSDVLADWFHLNGVPEAVTEELIGQGLLFRPFLRTVTDPELVDDGDHLHGWELVAAPGHADGQLTLLRDGVLIAADHLLARITPTVGLWPASRLDPLGDYLDALERTIALAPEIAYGGHGDTIADPVARARELIAHHDERLRQTVAALGPEPRTGYEVSFPLFGDDLRPAGRRFAVAETLSHLERLVRDGRAARHDPYSAGCRRRLLYCREVEGELPLQYRAPETGALLRRFPAPRSVAAVATRPDLAGTPARARNAFFVAAEYALVTARRTRLQELRGRRVARGARSVIDLITSDPAHFIAAMQVGSRLTSLAIGAVGEAARLELLRGSYPRGTFVASCLLSS